MSKRFRAQLVLIAALIAVGVSMNSATWSDDKPAAKGSDTPLTRDQARKLKSPVPFNKASIKRGQILYKRGCTECHGGDGKSLVDVVANATDLTNPKAYRSGVSGGEIYRSIRDGAGESMPPFAEKISKDEDFWHLANYLRSLWPESERPKYEESKAR
jgi:mono/diheme cytochrome c family protein